MEKLTKEQYEALTPYKDALRSAVKSSFARVSTIQFQEIAAIYAQVFTPLRKGQMSCNTCRLNALRKLGELYQAYEDSQEKTEEKKPGKKGRPKKLTEERLNKEEE